MYFTVTDMNEDTLARRLRALPDFDPPPGGWARLAARLDARRRRRRVWDGGLALAASLLLAVVLVLQSPAPAPVMDPDPLAPLVAQSQVLEFQLAQAQRSPAVWDGERAARAAQLEQHLALVDYQLNYAHGEQAEALWRNRVGLMNALLQTYRAPTEGLLAVSYTPTRID